MSFLQIIVLAIVQGITEFLPISSSAHLILVPQLADWPDQSLSFDVAVHVGTLIAVCLYFRHDLSVIVRNTFKSIVQPGQRLVQPDAWPEARLGWAIVIGTIPAGLAGLLGKDFIETTLRSPLVIAVTTIVFGLVLGIAYRYFKGQRHEHSVTLWDAVLIGLAQALALIPGTSRSGITMTAALMLGYSATAAARLSFLLSIPVISLAGLYLSVKLYLTPQTSILWADLLIGVILSALAAYACIYFFLAWLERFGMMPYVLYRLLLGALLLFIFW